MSSVIHARRSRNKELKEDTCSLPSFEAYRPRLPCHYEQHKQLSNLQAFWPHVSVDILSVLLSLCLLTLYINRNTWLWKHTINNNIQSIERYRNEKEKSITMLLQEQLQREKKLLYWESDGNKHKLLTSVQNRVFLILRKKHSFWRTNLRRSADIHKPFGRLLINILCW